MTKSQKNEFLKYLLKKKIPLRQAIEILEDTEKKIAEKQREKAVLGKYETR